MRTIKIKITKREFIKTHCDIVRVDQHVKYWLDDKEWEQDIQLIKRKYKDINSLFVLFRFHALNKDQNTHKK
jgi:hypothetical protein